MKNRFSDIRKRIVDKGTPYEREVCIDLNTTQGKQEELEAVIATYLQSRTPHCPGKTARHRRNGCEARKRERRAAHEGWMNKAATNPTHLHIHPFEASGK